VRDYFLAIERKKAKEREREGGRRKGSGNFPDPTSGNARDLAAVATGYSGRTLDKVDAVAALAGEVVFCLRRNLEKQPRPTTRSIPGRCGYYQ
jgi:hypothetical protein